MSNFKVGDKVAVYNPIGRTEGKVASVDGQFLEVDFGNYEAVYAEKQCRKIVKKRKKELFAWVLMGPDMSHTNKSFLQLHYSESQTSPPYQIVSPHKFIRCKSKDFSLLLPRDFE